MTQLVTPVAPQGSQSMDLAATFFAPSGHQNVRLYVHGEDRVYKSTLFQNGNRTAFNARSLPASLHSAASLAMHLTPNPWPNYADDLYRNLGGWLSHHNGVAINTTSHNSPLPTVRLRPHTQATGRQTSVVVTTDNVFSTIRLLNGELAVILYEANERRKRNPAEVFHFSYLNGRIQ